MEAFWWYLSLATSVMITEEAAPMLGGLAAQTGHLTLWLVGAWISVGTWVGGMLLYYLGRWRGHWARRRWPRTRRFMLRALKIVRRHPWRSSFLVRYAYGLRFTLCLACGAARVPLRVFAIGSAISSLTWAYGFALLGWALGRTTNVLLGHMQRYENALGIAILVAITIAFVVMRRRHVEDEVVVVLARGDDEPAPKVSE